MTAEELYKAMVQHGKRIAESIEPGGKVTIIVRYPGIQGAVFFSEDDIIEVEEALRYLRRQMRWAGNPNVVEVKA